MDLRKHIRLALAYFVVVALMGLLLRLYFVLPLQFNYKFLLHAHSHTALLGWIYLGLTTLIYGLFLAKTDDGRRYRPIFIFTNVSILGMLITFPLQGYALFSIIFSTLFLFASYWFAWFAFKRVPTELKHRFSWKLIKAALWYLVLSSIGPWTIGGVMATLGPESIWYKTSIYFYLHFQYNGWFILALLGVLFYFLEEKGVRFSAQNLKSFFLLLHASVILSLFLSVLWFSPPLVFYVLGFVGAVAQLLAFYEFYLLLRPHQALFKRHFGAQGLLLLKIAAGLLVAKIGMQLFSAHPYFASLIFLLKNFVIGYLHLVFLGVVIPVMMALLHYFGLLKISRKFMVLYLLAFATTEALIFYKALALWIGLPFFRDYYICLAVLSILFPVAVIILFVDNLKVSKAASSKRVSSLN